MIIASRVLLVCACALAVCVVTLRPVKTQSSLRRITNTTAEGISVNPSVSGDGNIVGFESTEDIAGTGGTNSFRAVRANISSDPLTFFQMGQTRAVAPAISQDGSRIAFASKDDPLGKNTDGNSEIFLFNGAHLLQITNTTPNSSANRVTEGNFQPSISDDGRYVAFSSNRNLTSQNGDGNLEIFVYDSVATAFTQLTNSSGITGFSDAKISGDGLSIGCIREPGPTASATRDLIRIDRTSAVQSVLATNIAGLALTYGRAISDDGARVVYSGETAANSTQVFFYDGRSGNVNRQVTTLGARVTEVPLHPTISGDGQRIAFATRRAVTGFGNSDASVELYTYDIPTGTFGRVTSAPAEADCFDGSSAACEVVSSLNDDGSTAVFNFPRALSGAVASGLENKSEIYATGLVARPPFGTLTSVLNQASLGHEPSSVKAVAPDSIVAAFGSALANTTQQSQKLLNGTFPTNVGGTTVTVNGRAAQIFFVSPDRVHFLAPPQTEIGTAEVVITNADGFDSKGHVPILNAAPGIFTKTGDGIGEGLVVNADALADGPFDPTGGNLRLLILGTGVRNGSQTIVNIGGRAVNAQSVTASSDMPGLDEVRLVVPADLRGAGTINLFIQSDGRESNPVTVTFSGDPSRNVVLNEVLADPPDGIAGDANHDGVRDGADDEFIELVNGTTNELISLSGWTIRTRATGSVIENTRFTFPSGTSLPAGEAIVVFGGGNFNPSNTVFGCAQVLKTTTLTGLSLTNSGLTILVRNAAGTQIASLSYGGSTGFEGENNQSLTRVPDITGIFVPHTAAQDANGRRFSPGLKTNGTPFGSCPSILTSVTVLPLSATLVVGQNQQFTAQAFDQYGRVMTGVTISFNSDNTNVATVESTSMNSSTGVATANLKGRNPGSANITVSATDGATTINSSPATLTVTGPSLSINDVTQSEGNSGPTTFTFTVTLSTPAPAPVTFDIATQNNTATVGNADYVARSLTAQTIPVGQQTYTFDVTVNGDLNIEPTEIFFVNVSDVSGASVSDAQGVGNIVTDDVPMLSVSDVSNAEGNSGTTTFTFTVNSSLPAPPEGITFIVATQDNSATAANGDYGARSLTLQSILAGQTSYTFDVTVNGDTTVEPNETFLVNISNVSANAAIADGQGAGTIQNDDAADLVISQTYPGGGLSGATFTNDYIELHNQGATTIDFAVTPYSVQFLSTSASSWAKTDLTSGTLPPGRYFLIRETSGGGAGLALPVADATGSLNLTSTTAGKVALVVGTTLLTGSCPGDDGSVPFNPVDRTAVDLVGYGGTSGSTNHCYEGAGPASYTFGNNTTADFRKLGGCQDTNNNANDFVTVTPTPRNSSSPVNDCQAADVEITKSDSPDPVVVGSNVTYTITVTNHGPASAQSVSVTDNLPANVTFFSCNSTGGGVCGGSGNNRTVTLPSLASGASFTATIIATANGPNGATASNTATVSSTTPDANSSNNSATATTLMQEPAPTLSIDDVAMSEGTGGTTNFNFTVTLTPSTSQTVTVNYATSSASPATATAGTDYVTTSGMLTFNPTDTTEQITVQVNGDNASEAICETFFVTLTSPVNATIADDTGQGGITDDDGTKLVISQIYGGGGNTGAPYANDFIEIFNRGNAAVSLNGMSVQYVAATTTTGSWSKTDLPNVTVQPGRYLLVQQASGGAVGSPLPTPDAIGTINMAAGSGRVALVNSTTALSATSCPSGATIIDLVGYGATAICREGSTTTHNSPGPSNNTTSAQRKLGGCQDTNSNNVDFAVALVNARNSSTNLNQCGCSTSYSSFLMLRWKWRKASTARLDISRKTSASRFEKLWFEG